MNDFEAGSCMRPKRRCWDGSVLEGGVEDAGGEVAEEVLEDEVDKGVRKPVNMRDPKLPTEEERKEHEMTHLPYRSWCRHCVRGRGKDSAHKTRGGRGSSANCTSTTPPWGARTRREAE